MSRRDKTYKPSRAERKAQKKAEKEAARQTDQEGQASMSDVESPAEGRRSFWGRRRRSKDVDPIDEAMTGDSEMIEMPRSDFEDFLSQKPVIEEASGGGAEATFVDEGDASNPPFDAAPKLEKDDEPSSGSRRFGMRIRRKKKPDESRPAEPEIEARATRGTTIRPVSKPDAAPATDKPASAKESFSRLRSKVEDGYGDTSGAADNVSVAHEEVLILDDPIIEPVAPARQTRARPVGAQQSGGLSENWLGLWVSEDGEAIFIEEDSDGWFAVTVLPDPTTTVHAGPDYPEIQSYRMPAYYSMEEVGEFTGERMSVITVPGLPETHKSPMMYIYFLTRVPEAEGGGNRFATPDDATRRVFIVADFELGTVNPWSNRDDIEWIDPSVNYYKAPGKLDAYMMRRMAAEDPLNPI